MPPDFGAAPQITIDSTFVYSHRFTVSNSGPGAAAITSAGTVGGLFVLNQYGADTPPTDLTVIQTTGTIASTMQSGDGISARNQGTGATTVATAGTVSASGSNGNGIFAENGFYTNNLNYLYTGTNLSVTQSGGSISGDNNGISAYNYGTGATAIAAAGTITGTGHDGIYVRNGVDATDLAVMQSDGTISGGGYAGITAYNYGTGATTVSTAGNVSGTQYGLDVANLGATPTPPITANLLLGAGPSMPANLSTATNLTVTQSAGTISGGSDGIHVANNGTGATSVTTAGVVTGTNGNGVTVYNGTSYLRPIGDDTYEDAYYPAGTDLTVTQSAGTISGVNNGIFAHNSGSGATTITTAGTVIASGTGEDEVTSLTGVGVYAYNGAASNTPAGTNLSVTQTAGTIQGGSAGIEAVNAGTGATHVTTAGTVTGTNTVGVLAANDASATDLTVTQTAGTISGGLGGIITENFGRGATSITTAGTVLGNGTAIDSGLGLGTALDGFGILAINEGSATGLAITQTAGTIGGSRDGILAMNFGTGATAINVAGTVSGGIGAGIVTASSSGAPVTITLNNGADVSAASGVAIVNAYGNAAVTLAGGSKLSGSVLLGGENNSLTIEGNADLSQATVLDGSAAVPDNLSISAGDFASTAPGTASNRLAFLGTTQAVAGANLLNWETVALNASSVTLTDGTLATGTGTNPDGSPQGLVLTNASTLASPASLAITGDVTIDGTSALWHAQGGTIAGNVSNAGLIGWENLGRVLTIAGNYTGVAGSRISLETWLAGGTNSTTDSLHITGNASGTTAIAVRPAVGSPGGLTTNSQINLVQVDGTSSTGNFVLASPVQAGAYEYALRQTTNPNSSVWSLASNSGSAPIYRPGVGAYVSGQAVNAEEGFFSVGTFHERRGENTITDAQGRQTWVRSAYYNFSADGKNRFSYSGAELYGVQAGQDLWATTTGAGTSVRAAFTLDYTRSDAALDDTLRPLAGLNARVGSLQGEDVSVGGTYSRVASNGTYLDVVAKVGFLRNKFSVADTGITYQSGLRATGSVEVGKPFAVWAGWSVEPQAQLIYMHTAYSSFADSVSSISGYDANALRGRVGTRINNPHLFGAEGKIQVYGLVDVLHDFIEPGKLTIGGTKISDDFRHTGFDVGLGGEYKVSKVTSLYGRGLYLRAFDVDKSDGYLFSAGLKTQF